MPKMRYFCWKIVKIAVLATSLNYTFDCTTYLMNQHYHY